MTQFSTLYTRLLDQELGTDDSTVLFTTARRQAAVNDGVQEFADLTECLVRTSTLVWPGGTLEINLSTLSSGKFVRLAADQSIEFHYVNASSETTYLSGDDLPQTTVRWLNDHEPGWRGSTVASSVMQLPAQYYLRADGPNLWLGMVPVPSTGSSASASVVVPYVLQPTPLSSDTSEPWTVNSSARTDLRMYHLATVHYAAHQLEKLRRDYDASDRQLQRFMGYVQRYLQAMRRKGGTTLSYARHYFRRGGRGTDRGADPRR